MKAHILKAAHQVGIYGRKENIIRFVQDWSQKSNAGKAILAP